MTLASTSMQLWKLLLLAFILIGYAVYKTVKHADEHPHDDPFMQMGLIALTPQNIFYGSCAVALIAFTFILGVLISTYSPDKFRNIFRNRY